MIRTLNKQLILSFLSLLICLTFLTLPNLSVAQTSNGTLAGKIVDESNGEIIFGARIVVDGTSKGAITDIDGYFTVPNVPEGSYTLVITALGYASKKIENTVIKAGTTVTINTTLGVVTKETKEVVVTGQARKESVSAILVQQKNAEAASNGISAESIKQSPDRNTGEVLKRVSGASIQDNKFAIIRGLSDRYNIATINGVLLPSSEPDRRAFSFDLIPASALENLVITKTATPDMPGDFSGGIIQLTTKDIPSENAFTVNLGSGYNSVSTFKPYSVNSYKSGETFGFTDNSRFLPGNFPTNYLSASSNSIQGINAGKLLTNNYTIDDKKSASPFTNINLVNTTFHKFNGMELGTLTSLVYSDQRKFYNQTRMFYQTQRIEDTNQASLDKVYTRNVTVGAVLNIGLKVGQYNKFFFKNTFNKTDDDMLTDRYTFDVGNNLLVKSKIYNYTTNRIYLTQLGGSHLLEKSNIKIDYVLGYGNLYRGVPDYKTFDYTKSSVDPGKFNFSTDPNSNRRFFSDLKDNNYNLSFKLTKTIKSSESFTTKLKAGYYYAYRTRSFNPRLFGAQQNDPNTFNVDLTQSYDKIMSSDNFRKDGFTLIEQTNPFDKYGAISKLNAIYAMADHDFKSKIRFIYGLRWEQQQQRIYSVFKAGDLQSIDKSIFPQILPSTNIIYSLNAKANLRFAYFRSVSRPELRELARFSFFDYNLNGFATGNPNLKQGTINNFDFRYEAYKRPNETFSLSAFYKNFLNPIETTIQPGGGSSNFEQEYQNLSAPNKGISGGSIYSEGYKKAIYNVFYKGYSAITTGIEIEYRTALSHDTTNRIFKDITFFGNLSLIYSQTNYIAQGNALLNEFSARPLQGQSPYVFNAGLQYTHPKSGTTFTLLTNRTGKRIYALGVANLNYFENPRTIVDLAVSKKFLKDKLNIKFTLSDLLNQPFVLYQNTHKQEGFRFFNDFGKLFTNFDEASRRIENRYEPGKDQVYFSRVYGWGGGLSISYTF